jgi:MbtH protein
MTNPFEDESASYRVLRNIEGQHSLWPADADIPDGWVSLHGPETRVSCLFYIESNWTDMRPSSLIASMAQAFSH